MNRVLSDVRWGCWRIEEMLSHAFGSRRYAVAEYFLMLRSRARLTQSELGMLIGVHRRSVQKWECGEAYPNAKPQAPQQNIYTLSSERGKATAPMQRTSPVTPPLQPTSFVGRSVEVVAIQRLLDNPACRLLTLLGPGGIGKTRLAIEVAAGQADAFADGVVFVVLASVATPNQTARRQGLAGADSVLVAPRHADRPQERL
jgi:hypothetical protein